MPRLITAEDICKATEEVLTAQLPRAVVALGLGNQLGAVTKWHHVPRLRAVSSAQFPAGVITTPGWDGNPRRHGNGSYDATWRLAVGIIDRGGNHDEVAARIRIWAAVLRGVLVRNPSLGGIGHSLLLKREAYDEYSDRRTTKTMGACAVSFNISVDDVVDFHDVALAPQNPDDPPVPGNPPVDPDDPPGPPFIPDPSFVESIHPEITIRPEES